MSSAFMKPGSFDRTSSSNDTNMINPSIHNRYKHLPLHAQSSKLPIASHKNEILYALERYRVVIIAGETGSGKSTQIPQFLHQGGWTAGNRTVVCTQPQSLSVIATAARVADEQGQRSVGGLVGFSTHHDHRTSAETRMKFCTDRFLVQEMMFRPTLANYSVVMVDEAHERRAHTDVLLGLLRMLLRRRSDFRLIVASATMDVPRFLKYFSHLMVDTTQITRIPASSSSSSSSSSVSTHTPLLSDVVPLFVGRRRYHIDTQFLHEACGDYLVEAVRTVIKIHQTERPGAILLFLPDQRQVAAVVSELNEWSSGHQESSSSSSYASFSSSPSSSSTMSSGRGRRPGSIGSGLGRLSIVPLHGSMSSQDQLRAMRPARAGERKVVVSTSIAESSLTIDDIVYVVDACFERTKHFDPASGTDVLVTEPISCASAVQRAGRAGRTRPGKCFRLCTLKTFQTELRESAVPQIERCNLTEIILQLKALGVDDVLHFPYLSPPPVEMLMHALESLYALGALNDQCQLTRCGYQMADFPCTPQMTKMLMASVQEDCVKDILTLAGMLSIFSIFTQCRTQVLRQQRDLSHQEFAADRGDHNTLLNIMNEYERSSDREAFATQHCLSARALKRARHVRRDLRRHMSRVFPSKVKKVTKHDSYEPDATSEQVLKCVLAGFFQNVARLHGSGKYRTIQGGALVSISKDSVLEKFPDGRPCHWVVFHQAASNNGEIEVYECSSISPQWLLDVKKHYYQKVQTSTRLGGVGADLYFSRHEGQRPYKRARGQY
jgi:ATP-dependent RNA helicase DDX35